MPYRSGLPRMAQAAVTRVSSELEPTHFAALSILTWSTRARFVCGNGIRILGKAGAIKVNTRLLGLSGEGAGLDVRGNSASVEEEPFRSR